MSGGDACLCDCGQWVEIEYQAQHRCRQEPTEQTVLDWALDVCTESVRAVGLVQPPAEYAKAVLRALIAMPVEQRMKVMGMVGVASFEVPEHLTVYVVDGTQ